MQLLITKQGQSAFLGYFEPFLEHCRRVDKSSASYGVELMKRRQINPWGSISIFQIRIIFSTSVTSVLSSYPFVTSKQHLARRHPLTFNSAPAVKIQEITVREDKNGC